MGNELKNSRMISNNLLANAKPLFDNFLNVISRHDSLLYLLIILFAAIPYIQTLWFEFLPLDDEALIVNRIQWLKNINHLPDLFRIPVFLDPGIYYRPILTMSFMFDAILGNGDPSFFHFSSVFSHIIVAMLLFYLMQLVGLTKSKSLVLSLLFSVNPINVHAVAWISGRNDVIAAIFVLMSLICFIKANSKRSLFWFILHNVSYIFALFTKESMIVLPLIFYSYYFLFFRAQNKKIFKYIISWSVITVTWLIIRSNVVDNLPIPQEWNSAEVIQNAFLSVVFNIGKMIIPVDLKIIPTIANSSIYPSLIVFLLFIICIPLFGLKDRKLTLFGLVLFISILIIPIVSIPENPIQNENRLYIPLIGMLLILSQIDFGSKLRTLPPRLLPIFIVALISVFISRSFTWAKVYKEPFVYTGVIVLQSPDDPQSYFIRAGVFLNTDMYIVAIADYTKAIEVDPNWRKIAQAYYNRGFCYSRIGMFEKAMEDFEKSLELNPSHYRSYIGVGFTYYDLGDFESAIQNTTQSIKVGSIAHNMEIYEAYLIRAMAHAKIGDYINSAKDYNKAVEMHPFNMNIYDLRSILMSEIVKDSTAIEKLNDMISGDENVLLGYYCLGLADFGRKEFKTALDNFRKSIEMNPQFEDVYNMHGLTYYNLDQYSSSLLDFNQALEMNSMNYQIYNNRAKALFALDRYKEALDDLYYAIEIGGKADTTLINNIKNVLNTDN